MFLLCFLFLLYIINSQPTRCHFTINSKVYIIKSLQKQSYYKIDIDQTYSFFFNFCYPVNLQNPPSCESAYSILVNYQNQTCTSFSSYSLFYQYSFQSYNGQYGIGLIINQYSGMINPQTGKNRQTKIIILCGDSQQFYIDQIELIDNGDTMYILGSSKYGCPALQISGMWQALSQNQIIFGLVLFFIGIAQLFFGRKMINPTLFIACYCIGFSIFGAFISEILVKPNASFLWIYICLLLTIISASLFAYMSLGLAHISIFFIGAWMGLIVAILVNTIFIKITGISTVWSLILFCIIFCVGFGMLTFRYYDQILILSTCITGAYMIIRPISWIFKGYPNQFLVAQQLSAGQFGALPGTFFIYLFLMIILTIIGCIYQFLQLKRQKQACLQIGIVQQKIQNSVQLIRNSINAIINKYKISQEQQITNQGQYIQFQELNRYSLDGDKQAGIKPVNSMNRKSIKDSSLKQDIYINNNVSPVELRFSDSSSEDNKRNK